MQSHRERISFYNRNPFSVALHLLRSLREKKEATFRVRPSKITMAMGCSISWPGREWGGGPASRFWTDQNPKWHIIGKNVWKFHAVYWPALLLSAGLPVPDRIIAHGFLTTDGIKISKSGQSAPDPNEYIRHYGADALRYFLLRHVRQFGDTDFSETRLGEAYEADLANGLGNLCSRLAALCESVALNGLNSTPVTPDAPDTPEALPPAPPRYHADVRAFRFDRALDAIWEEIGRIDREIAHAQPWQDVRVGRHELVRDALLDWAQRLDALACWLSPFLPASAAAIRASFATRQIRKGSPLFPRLVTNKTQDAG